MPAIPNVPTGFTGYILWIKQGRGRQPYRVMLASPNRKICLMSEGYPTRAHATRAAQTLSQTISPSVIV